MSRLVEDCKEFLTNDDNLNTIAGVALMAAEVGVVSNNRVLTRAAWTVSGLAAGIMVAQVLPRETPDYFPSAPDGTW